MAIPGTGNDSKNKWRPYTYVRAIKTTWLQLDELVKTVGVVSDLKVSFEPVDEIKAALEKQGSKFSALLAEFKMLRGSGEAWVRRIPLECLPGISSHKHSVFALVHEQLALHHGPSSPWQKFYLDTRGSSKSLPTWNEHQTERVAHKPT
ncbi:hypothetical protein GN958_ATG21924 [Phytophthora infestans]|uniref:Uncharacterized protein n=1 Tax=Phytophthora infestans TaxID=4787 RepID=A0A8S9TLJ2_PHYIN|nr:hypothetical protein GN958_ATG21924 [Phytophthora infestans]